MELKGTKTEKNLMEAFAGESMARNKYTYFASVAKKEGYEQLAAIFEETAGNEKEHAKLWFKALCGGSIPDTLTCLEMAASGENEEWTDMYPRMAAEAKEEASPSWPLSSRWWARSKRSTRHVIAPLPPTSRRARSLPVRNSRCGSAGTAATPISASLLPSSVRSAHIPRATLS